MFYEQQVQESTVVTALMSSIRTAFKNDGDGYHLPFYITVQQAIATRSLFESLGLLSNHQNSLIMNNGEITLSREAFIIEHPAFFKDNSLLKGAFLLGCLTGILVRAQEKNLGSKPIYKRLNNLSIGTDELISLHPRLVNKIAQYQERKRPNGLPSDRRSKT